MTSQSAINTRKVPVVGILGAIGSGKSFVAQGAARDVQPPWLVLDADRAGHDVLREEDVRTRLVELFTGEILGADGEIERRKLAALVFGDLPAQKTARQQLEQVVHPQIRSRLLKQIDDAHRNGFAAVILDAAILLETGWRSLCDYLVYIDTSEAHRHAQITRRGWTIEDLNRREASQWPIENKKALADLVIFNDLKTNTAALALRQSIQSWLKVPPAASQQSTTSSEQIAVSANDHSITGNSVSQHACPSLVEAPTMDRFEIVRCFEAMRTLPIARRLVCFLKTFENSWWRSSLSLWNLPLKITSQLVGQPSP